MNAPKPTDQVIQALVNLRGNRDFEIVLDGIMSHAAFATRQCVDLEGSLQLRAAGAVKALEHWGKTFAEAPTMLSKIKSNQ